MSDKVVLDSLNVLDSLIEDKSDISMARMWELFKEAKELGEKAEEILQRRIQTPLETVQSQQKSNDGIWGVLIKIVGDLRHNLDTTTDNSKDVSELQQLGKLEPTAVRVDSIVFSITGL